MALTDSLVDELDRVRPGSTRTRDLDRLAVAHDASHYLLTPAGVVTIEDAEHLADVLRLCRGVGQPVAFRSGGTSLSGQASSDALQLDVRRRLRRIEVLDGGARVRVEPGATVRQVNARLLRHGRKLGPDPASEVACTVGGVIANNSSGMACGTESNTYRTIESAVLVLPSGLVVDTGLPDADAALRSADPDLWQGLLDLRDRVRADPRSVETIREQYTIKNTMGYSVNAFLDFDRPVDILLHLVVGSEGTLAFVASAVLRTVPLLPRAATGMLYFASIADATAALPSLVATGLATIELLDSTSLRVAQRDAGADPVLRSLDVVDHAALLVEYQEPDDGGLEARLARLSDLLPTLPLVSSAELTRDPTSRNALWHIRKDLYATVAGNRPSGTTALLEDIAVPVERLRAACEGLQRLFAEYEYGDAVIFGHAKDGNIHFMLTARFDDAEELGRYSAFTEDMVSLVLGLRGTLKAEHGTGRIMAPYVRRQFGDELYEVMRQVKRLVDPSVVLNPGVLLSEDPAGPLSHLKSSPTVESEVDRCVECGYCEPVCPSRDLTLTPRQRIVIRRERERAEQAGDMRLVRELDEAYAYDGVDTCAVDGMCATTCPVLINTGSLMKRLRGERDHGPIAGAWTAAASHWGPSTKAGATAMSVAKMLPARVVTGATDVARAVLGDDTVPRWTPDLPGGGSPRKPIAMPLPAAVYLPSCIGAMFGPAEGGDGVRAALLRLAERAGVGLVVPEGVDDMCCGTPWSSKGHARGRDAIRAATLPNLLAASGGTLPVVSDGVSCTEGLLSMAADSGLAVLDAVAFVEQELLPRLEVRRRLGSLAVHPTCSSTHLGVTDPLLRIADAIADEVVVPDDWACCGFAGDRGMLHPELTAAATAPEARALADRVFDAYASANRTCEIGMTRATGQQYRHILELLDEATRP